jgi:EmrB/QacA subfamily drug resistance transporter
MTTNKPAISAQEHAATFTSKMRTIALVIVALAFVMDLLDSTIVNIAIPAIRDNLHASFSAIQWVIAGYSLAFSLLLVTGGRMGDVFGYKKLFMIGIGGFTLASLMSGVSGNSGILIAARLIQGSMAALMVPQVMSLMQVMYKPEERAAVNGLFGALGGLAASLGPVIGGLLIKANLFNLDWRPIFLINIPIGILGLIAGAKYLPNGKSAHPLKLDIIGTLIIVVAMLLLVFPLIQGRELNWPTWTLIMIVASLPVFGLFAWWQRRKDAIDGSPLVLPALFKKRSFSLGLGINVVFQMAMIGYFLAFTLLLQIGMGFSAIHAAVTGLPTAVGVVMAMAILGEKVIPKLGRYALSLGALVMGIGLAITAWILHRYGIATHSWQLIPGVFFTGVGMGLMFASLFAAVLNGVDVRHAGSASGTFNAVQQVAGAIGVAIVGVIFFGQLTHAAATSFTSVEPQLRAALSAQHVPAQEQAMIIRSAKNCFVDRTNEKDSSMVPQSCKQTESGTTATDKALATAITNNVVRANATNFDNAFRWSIGYSVILLALGFGLTFLLPARFKTQAYTEGLVQ